MKDENGNDAGAVAKIILEQLGGGRFATMTGAWSFLFDGPSLWFALPSNFAKDGINKVKITRDPSDTYTVTFYKMGRAPKYTATIVEEISDVYAESLRTVFTQTTGLETSLGTMQGAR